MKWNNGILKTWNDGPPAADYMDLIHFLFFFQVEFVI